MVLLILTPYILFIGIRLTVFEKSYIFDISFPLHNSYKNAISWSIFRFMLSDINVHLWCRLGLHTCGGNLHMLISLSPLKNQTIQILFINTRQTERAAARHCATVRGTAALLLDEKHWCSLRVRIWDRLL